VEDPASVVVERAEGVAARVAEPGIEGVVAKGRDST
jgi:ATP-dependent DNA ligase